MHLENRLFGKPPDFVIEVDRVTAPILPVEQRPALYPKRQHFFQTKRLCAELHLVAAVGLRFAALVLDGVDGAVPVKLDDIGLPAQTEPLRTDRESPRRAHPPLRRLLLAVGPFVQHPAFGRVPVLDPYLFQVDQGTLARAVEVVLQGGEHDVVGFVIHGTSDA